MKILKLRFKNLNSLHGEWQIDFTANDYTADGIFAITGPTGAGKSTILDAICLALYGTTPRLGKVSKGTNEIMSRKTGECFAEVIFESQKGVFCCHWSQRRAKGKADGNLQEPQQELSDVKTGKVLENKKTQIAETIKTVTGMDFTRFTRSIMLAQGGFAAFLQASGSERTPILEQITGTGIYSEISSRVFERQKLENIKLDTLMAETSGISVLTAEEEQRLNAELADRQRLESELKLKQKETSEALLWLENIDRLKKEIADLGTESGNAETAINAFKPQREKLARAMQAAELDVEFSRLETLIKQQQNDSEALQREKSQLSGIAAEVDNLRSKAAEADRQLTDLKNTLKQQQPIWQQIRAADVQLAEKNQVAETARTEAEKAAGQLSESRSRLAVASSEHAKTEKELEKQLKWLADNAGDELLVSQLAAINEHFAGLQKSLAELQKRRSEILADEKQLKKLEKELKSAEKQFKEQQSALEEIKKQITEQNKRLNELLENKKISEYRSELKFLRKENSYLQLINDYEKARSTVLEDGRPCPLCGAVEHPFALGNVPEISENEKQCNALEKLIEKAEELEEEIRLLNDSEKNVQKSFSEAEKTLIQLNGSRENSDKNLAEKNTQLVELENSYRQQQTTVSEKLQTFGVADLPDDSSEVIAALQVRLQNWQNNQKHRAELELRVGQLKSAVAGANDLVATAEKALTEKQSAFQKLKHEYDRLQTDRSNTFGTLNPDQEEARLTEQIATAEKNEKILLTQLNNSSARLVEVQTRCRNLEDSISNRSQEISTAEQVFNDNLVQRRFSDKAEFISCRLSAEERQSLAETEQKLKTTLAEIVARLRDRQNSLAHEQQRQLTQASSDELRTGIDSVNLHLKTVSEETGAVRQRLTDNQKARQLISDKQQFIDRQKLECQKWNRLNDLIGSKDGAKFRYFVQGLTFGIVLNHANQQLKKMTDRYLLIRDTEQPLELKVIDSYQAGEVRSTKNLSGGESFIVSLSLALGLSQMASRNVRVDSLFLDEGFGTLDDESLTTALDTLAGLHQSGKLIGVISHVPALKERIRTQIAIKKSSGGHSTLTGPGIQRL